MRAAGGLFLAGIPTVRPLHNPERRRSRPADVALKAAAFARDGHGMTRTGVCFRPAVQDRTGPTMFNVPAVERAFSAPASGGRDDQVRRLQQYRIGLQEYLQVACSALDPKVGKVGLQPLSQGLRLVPANRRGAQRVPTDVRPTQDIIVDQNDPASARLRKRAGNWPTDRSAPDDDHGGIQQLFGSRIMSAPVHPIGICALDRTSDDRTASKIASKQHRFRRTSRSEALGQRVGNRARTRTQLFRVGHLDRDETRTTTAARPKHGNNVVWLAHGGLAECCHCIVSGTDRQGMQVRRCFRIFDRERRLRQPNQCGLRCRCIDVCTESVTHPPG